MPFAMPIFAAAFAATPFHAAMPPAAMLLPILRHDAMIRLRTLMPPIAADAPCRFAGCLIVIAAMLLRDAAMPLAAIAYDRHGPAIYR